MNFPSYTITPRTQWFGQRVDGAHYYMPVVRHIVSQVPQGADGSHCFSVSLVLEPDNPAGEAISVRFDDHVIGYLPQPDVAQYWPELATITVNGLRPVTRAKLTARGDLHGPNPEVELSITMAPAGLIIPANEPPIQTYALLPWGEAIQVLKESEHFDQLRHYLTECSDALLLVTLHATEQEGKRIVEVRLDGAPVGELTAASSAHLLPAIDHLSSSGLLSVCRAQLTGSQFGAQLTLYVARGHEMGQDVVHPEISPLGRLNERTTLGVPAAWQGDTTTRLPQVRTIPTPAPQGPATAAFAAPAFPALNPTQPVINSMATNVAQQNVYIGNVMPQYAALPPVPPKDMTVAYVLWLFLGFFGVHRMYLRDYVGGVLQLLTAGGFGLWWLLDLALIPGMVRRRNQGF